MEYINRKAQTYYLHQGKTKTGKPKYYFSMKKEGLLLDTIPDGWEIYENPNAQVFLRKIKPKFITDEEISLVKLALKKDCLIKYHLIDVKDNIITIYLPDQDVNILSKIITLSSGTRNSQVGYVFENNLSYSPMMKFILIDTKDRIFKVQRYCFRGSIDGWIEIGGVGKLQDILKEYVKYLGHDSYYELL
jgi:hypothetical protein